MGSVAGIFQLPILVEYGVFRLPQKRTRSLSLVSQPGHKNKYRETCISRPPLGLEKGSLYLKVVFISKSILHIPVIRTVCS